MVDQRGVTVLAGGDAQNYGFQNGIGEESQFIHPADCCAKPSGSLLVAEMGAHCIRRIGRKGNVAVLAGRPGHEGFRDGAPQEAQFREPRGICMLPNGDVVVADFGNHRIRRILADGTVTTLAGSGSFGTMDGPMKQAKTSLIANNILSVLRDSERDEGLLMSLHHLDVKLPSEGEFREETISSGASRRVLPF